LFLQNQIHEQDQTIEFWKYARKGDLEKIYKTLTIDEQAIGMDDFLGLGLGTDADKLPLSDYDASNLYEEILEGKPAKINIFSNTPGCQKDGHAEYLDQEAVEDFGLGGKIDSVTYIVNIEENAKFSEGAEAKYYDDEYYKLVSKITAKIREMKSSHGGLDRHTKIL
jgi:hypothetical protein